MPKLPGFANPLPVEAVGQPDVLLNRARQAMRDGRPGDAARIYQRLLRLDPTNTELCNDLGALLGERGAFDEALRWYETSVQIDPDQPRAWLQRGLVLTRLGRLAEALSMIDRAVALRPGDLTLLAERAAALSRMGNHEEALRVYDALLAHFPRHAGLATNRGLALQWCGRFDDAAREYDRAILLDPGQVQAAFNKSQLLILRGAFQEGMRLFDQSWRAAAGTGRPVPPGPVWTPATAVAGKTVLVYWEQGYGDTIQYSRYVANLAAAGARVVLEVQKPLVELMTTLPGAGQVISNEDTRPAYDYQVPLMRLPVLFDTIPTVTPYVSADPALSAGWRDRLAGLSGRRVGLVWAGRSGSGSTDMASQNFLRSLPSLSVLAPLWTVEGCSFVSLQLDGGGERPPDLPMRDDTDRFATFADTAAVIENLDLTITVDTAAAHLAGAMGKPVWLMNRFDTDPRWTLNQPLTPWYPSMRIFRQPTSGDWASVIAAVVDALRSLPA